MIAASYTELERSTRDFDLAYEAGIGPELQDMAKLRNFVAHPNSRLEELSTYDNYARYAEALIVKVKDEGRLQKLWERREAMRLQAERMLSEIKEREAIAELDGSYVHGDGVWESRHLKPFRYLLSSTEDCQWRHDPENVDPAVCRVIERWVEMNPWEPSSWRKVED
jgi:hypothetical protein